MTDLARQSHRLGALPALLVVDMINSFTDPASPLGSDSQGVVEANVRLLQAFRVQGLPVFFTTVVYHDERQASVFRARLPALNMLTPHSDAVAIDHRLKRRADETLVEKQYASAFFGTPLTDTLRAAFVDSLVVTGLTTSGCVRATVVDGLQHDFPVFVPQDAVGDRNHEAHLANLHDMHAKYADVVDSHELIRQLASGVPT